VTLYLSESHNHVFCDFLRHTADSQHKVTV